MKNDKTELGKKGEEIARKHLITKGYKIIETNWRFQKNEVDIIAQKDNLLIIIEVKTRKNDFEDPREAVTIKKQRAIIKTANAYIETYDIENETRFDIITVHFKNNKIITEHIEDAFYPLL